MNFYFVFEGKTEPIVYRKWFSFLLPQLTEVYASCDVKTNNYYSESDMGIPDCFRVAAKAIQEINEYPEYDYLVLIIDSDRLTVRERESEAIEKIRENLKNLRFKSLPSRCELIILVQNVCIETWFLGNRKFFVGTPESEILKQYINYFDVSVNNPEELALEFVQNEFGTQNIFGYSTKALFHEGYLREIFKERNWIITKKPKAPQRQLVYRKSRPMEVQEEFYLKQIIARINEESNHLHSFQNFLDFCRDISQKVN